MNIPQIDHSECASRLRDGVFLLDVREPDEYVAGHVPGAHHIPLGEVESRVTDIPEGEVMVICRSGHRSLTACTFLAGKGRSPVNVSGGTLSWIDAGRDVVVGSERG